MWNPRTKHTPEYYSKVLAIILAGLKANWRRSTIRNSLNADGIKSPTGTPWTDAAIAGVLARLKRRQGHFFHTLLWLTFTDAIIKEDAFLLLGTQ